MFLVIKLLLLLLKTLLYLTEFNLNFTYTLWSATAEDDIYHKEIQNYYSALKMEIAGFSEMLLSARLYGVTSQRPVIYALP
jgi:hypothetical protein